METPRELRAIDRQGATVRTYEYDGESIISVDFGPTTDEIEVDAIGETVIVVVNGQQLEFTLPTEASDVSANNGVLTIKG